jgi:RNA polymerase sigma-70 factor (ECF subfamily)
VATAAAGAAESERPLAERLGGEAFARFYDEVAPRLWGFLFSSTGDRALADDLAQEAFTRVLVSRLVPQNDEHLKRYLFKTAIHLLRDRGRVAHRAPLPLVEEMDLAGREAPVGLRLDLEQALARLAERERRILWLAHVEGLDHRTIADALGARVGSVRVMLFRARRKLAKLMGREMDDERRGA